MWTLVHSILHSQAGFTLLVADLLATIAINVSYWNWYGFPATYPAACMTTGVAGFICLGLVAAAVLWASDVFSMNDGSEFRYAVSIVDAVLMDLWNVLPIHFAEYFRPKKLLLAGQTWDIFAACFCSEPDQLSQWRAYADNAKGVAIGFRVQSLLESASNPHEFALIPIQYDPAYLRAATRRMCDFALRLAASESLPYYEVEIFGRTWSWRC